MCAAIHRAAATSKRQTGPAMENVRAHSPSPAAVETLRPSSYTLATMENIRARLPEHLPSAIGR
jgi:hypothetical protein